MKRFLSALCACLMVMMFLSGCSSNQQDTSKPADDSQTASDPADNTAEPEAPADADTAEEEHEPVTLRVYAKYIDADTRDPFDYAVEKLKEEMPWITIELEEAATDDGQKLTTYAATGDMPDIFQASFQMVNVMKESGNILDITDKMDEIGFTDKVLPSCQNTLYHPDDGRIYAAPYAGNEVFLIYINKELFETYDVKIPETLDELEEAAKTFSAAGVTPLSIFAKEKWPCAQFYDVIASRYIPDGIKGLDLGTNQITEEGYKQAAQKILDLYNAGLFAQGATNMNYDQAASMFYEGKAAMFFNGCWEIPASTEALGDKVDWIFIPAASEDQIESTKYNFSGGASGPGGHCVSATTEHPDEAAEVAAFLSEKFAEYNYCYKGAPVVALKVDLPLQCEMSPMNAKLAEALPLVTNTTSFGLPNSVALKAAVQDESQRLIAGLGTADEFVEHVEAATY